MGRPSRFSSEARERAIRLLMEQRTAHPSEWAAAAGGGDEAGHDGRDAAEVDAASGARHRPATGLDRSRRDAGEPQWPRRHTAILDVHRGALAGPGRLTLPRRLEGGDQIQDHVE